MKHDAEGMRAGRDRVDGGAEHFLLFLQRHADDVVDRQQRPNQQHRRQQRHANAVDRAARRRAVISDLAAPQLAHQQDHQRDQQGQRRQHRRHAQCGIAQLECVADAQGRQHMRRQRRPAAGDEAHGVEITQRPDGGEHGADQVHTGHQRQGHVPEFLDPAGAIDIRGLIKFRRNGHAPGEENHGPERQPFPDMAINHRTQREAGIVEPWGPSTCATCQITLFISPHWPFSIQWMDR